MAADDNIDLVLAERGSRYGSFESHAKVTRGIKALLLEAISDNSNPFAPDQYEAIEMICHKLGRIVNGDPNYADSWVDIAGYAKLVADRLNGVSR